MFMYMYMLLSHNITCIYIHLSVQLCAITCVGIRFYAVDQASMRLVKLNELHVCVNHDQLPPRENFSFPPPFPTGQPLTCFRPSTAPQRKPWHTEAA